MGRSFAHMYLGLLWLSVDLRRSLETSPRGWESKYGNSRPLKGRQAALEETGLSRTKDLKALGEAKGLNEEGT